MGKLKSTIIKDGITGKDLNDAGWFTCELGDEDVLLETINKRLATFGIQIECGVDTSHNALFGDHLLRISKKERLSDEETISKPNAVLIEQLQEMMTSNAEDTKSALAETTNLDEYILEDVSLKVEEPSITKESIVVPITGLVLFIRE